YLYNGVFGVSAQTYSIVIGGREIELGVGDLRTAQADLVCLGHIHKAQNWGEVYYSGSITRLNFGEAEDKGFWVHRFDSGKGRKVVSEFIKTPAREMVTLDCDALPSSDALPLVPEGACVRLRYRVSEEDVHKVDEKALREKLSVMGAAEITIEKTVAPRQRVRAEGISGLVSLEEKLRKWAEISSVDISEGVFRKLAMLETDETFIAHPESIAV
ncbi:MAG: hypothetical protein NUV84_04820, partial [Candidatus Uhrbacteria bacterium]|nr:hypothetical protein [Candidatus Uhrbacteria bacterium]